MKERLEEERRKKREAADQAKKQNLLSPPSLDQNSRQRKPSRFGVTNEAGATFVPDLPDDVASDKDEEGAAQNISDRDSSDSAAEDESDGGEEETPAMKALRQLGSNSMHLENMQGDSKNLPLTEF